MWQEQRLLTDNARYPAPGRMTTGGASEGLCRYLLVSVQHWKERISGAIARFNRKKRKRKA